jgi:phosphoribosylformimino-5-aminoimidazole carboxamide ribotide isomerase
MMEIFPAIDLRRGRCVRLERGAADRETVYTADPLQVARRFVECGANWMHVVDLDSAFGDGSNRALVRDLAASVPLRVQVGGGLRSEHDIAEVLEAGAARAVIGTAAIEQPALVRAAVDRWGAERIAVGVDARGRRPAVRGWREETDLDLFDLGSRLVDLGVRTLIYTDIERDGMFSGPNTEMSLQLAEQTGAQVIVSGGVGSMDDLRAVAEAGRVSGGLEGVIVGKAIYERKIDLAEAVVMIAA